MLVFDCQIISEIFFTIKCCKLHAAFHIDYVMVAFVVIRFDHRVMIHDGE